MKTLSLLVITLFLTFSAFGQINVKDSIQIILSNDTSDVQSRFNNAYVVIYLNSLPEESEQLGMNVLYPFVQKNWERKSEQLSFLSQIYLLVAARYYERGGEDKYSQSRLFWEKSLETAQKAGNDEVCAISLSHLGTSDISQGNTASGQQYLYEAITYSDKQGMYVQSASLLYNIAGSFFDIKDTEGMARVLAQMEDYFKKDNSKQSQHQYNVIKHRYFGLLVEKEKKKTGRTDSRLMDSAVHQSEYCINGKPSRRIKPQLPARMGLLLHGKGFGQLLSRAKRFDCCIRGQSNYNAGAGVV